MMYYCHSFGTLTRRKDSYRLSNSGVPTSDNDHLPR